MVSSKCFWLADRKTQILNWKIRCVETSVNVYQSSLLNIPEVQRCNLSIYPSIHPFIHPPVRLSACPPVRLSVRPSVRLSVRPSACPSVRPPARPPARPSACPPVRPSVYPSIHLCYVILRYVKHLGNIKFLLYLLLSCHSEQKMKDKDN